MSQGARLPSITSHIHIRHKDASPQGPRQLLCSSCSSASTGSASVRATLQLPSSSAGTDAAPVSHTLHCRPRRLQTLVALSWSCSRVTRICTDAIPLSCTGTRHRHWQLHLTTQAQSSPIHQFPNPPRPGLEASPDPFLCCSAVFLCYGNGSVRPRNAVAARLCPLTDTSYRILARSLFASVCFSLLHKVQVLFVTGAY